MISSTDALLLKYISASKVNPKVKNFFYENMDLFINNKEEFKKLFEETFESKWDILIFNLTIFKNKKEIYRIIDSQINEDMIEHMLINLFDSKEKVSHDMKINEFKVTLSIEV